MSTLPSPPPSPLSYKSRHRRNDSFLLVQEIIKEQEKEALKFNKVRYSCPAAISEEEVIPRKSKSSHSVKFTTDPPKVFHYI
ncbi:hypothetical protein G6F57_002801 [Rhizopus arrhizus]|jgi:hypothetical protein|uniref:Uncharacterized protein n=1 Tax=Rhizopus oryzae TaxID=64495 RepID=A0A9P6WY94_RHIOR|nr:hypothetical protein G6F24_005218 [Rhizopus arrhizus]KAG0791137.1 hypothetical protein G6F21_005297 [Rhizopus arrhizus]KAG0813116.1 hypothetical protein G6F20_005813 [Rhizopus arrhizus]KAG0824251.1 hypothetical protein G6F18_010965 [Rhizopus arrhizus]KAG0824905.1 hypothetical protein G6F19_010093 [Rhizopus arrhizus]